MAVPAVSEGWYLFSGVGRNAECWRSKDRDCDRWKIGAGAVCAAWLFPWCFGV